MQLTLPPLAGQTDTAARAENVTSEHTKALLRRRERVKTGFIALGLATGFALALTTAQWFLATLGILASLWAMAWMLYRRIDGSVWQSYAVDRQAFLDDNEPHPEGAVRA